MKLIRRKFLQLAAGAVALPAISRSASAQAYPSQPIRIIVGFAAGSGSDIFARLMAQWLSERIGQTVLVENRPGGGGNIGTEAVVKAPPDGYTLLQWVPGNMVNNTLYEKLNFNFLRDIAPVAGTARAPYVLVVNNDAAGQDRSGIHRPRQGQSRQAQLCLGRRRHRHPHGGRAVQADGRGRHGARALPRRRPAR